MSAELAALPEHKPTGFYFRRAIREEEDPERLRAVALCILNELEALHQWIADEFNETPPRWYAMQSEIEAKGWAKAVDPDPPERGFEAM